MTRDGGEVMVTASGDVLLTDARRYLSSPLFVSADFEFDQMHQRVSPHRGDAHHQASAVMMTSTSSPI